MLAWCHGAKQRNSWSCLFRRCDDHAGDLSVVEVEPRRHPSAWGVRAGAKTSVAISGLFRLLRPAS